jgi:hypothetical protein
MRSLKLLTATAAVAAVAVPAAVAPSAGASTTAGASASAAQSVTREVEGTVLSVSRKGGWFRLRDSERGTFRIYVTRRTRFERLRGLSSLRRGMRDIEADIRRRNGRWVATEVERSGGGGRHGDDDDRDDD